MSNFDYETGVAKPGITSPSGGLGILLLLLVVIGLLALFSFFGGGTTPNAADQIGVESAPVAADAPVVQPPAEASD